MSTASSGSGKLDAIVMAGGYLDQHMADVVGQKCKTLIAFEGVTILHRTLVALRESGCVDRIVVVGTKEVIDGKSARLADQALAEGGSGPNNIRIGLKWLEDQRAPDRILVCTSDLCFLTPDAIRTFVMAAGDKDIYAPLVESEEWNEAYPTCTATFVSLTDGKFTLGGLYNVRASALKKVLGLLDGAFANRKSKLGMAKLLGFGFVWGYLMKKLAVADVVKRAEEVTGCSLVPIPQSPAELAYDIDALDDYYYAIQNYRNCTAGKWMPPNAENAQESAAE